jgi:hypothetical protein
MLALSLVLADAAEEGRRIIIGMLVVGLIFLSVIVLGEALHWLRSRGRHY